MLPILPKVSKLQQMQISSFGGIDRRNGAKENTFAALCGIDNTSGNGLETGNCFYCAQPEFEIQGENVIFTTDENGSKDFYCLGKEGFYKNGSLLPVEITPGDVKELAWLNDITDDFEFDDNGKCEWKGDNTNTKLIGYNGCVFAIPQMLYTDGTKTYRWDSLTVGNLKRENFTLSQGVLKIKMTSSGARKKYFGNLKKGDVLEIFFEKTKKEGNFTYLGISDNYVEFKAAYEDGESYTDISELITQSNSGVQFGFRFKDLPKFSDAVVVYNRMWGISGNRVYASSLARPGNFKESDGTESDAWWADTQTGEDFVAIASLNGRIVAFKKNSTYEIYGTVTPYTIKDVSRSLGCVSRDSVSEVNGVLFLLTDEGMSVYGGSKFININEALMSNDNEVFGIGKGSKYYALMSDGVYKYDYYTGLWTNVTEMTFKRLACIDFDIFGITSDSKFVQLTGEKKSFLSYTDDIKKEWKIESAAIGSKDFYAEGINKLELRFESEEKGKISVEVARDGGVYEFCGQTETRGGWQIFSVPISFVPCSSFKYRVNGFGKMKLRLISYSYRKGGDANKYE